MSNRHSISDARTILPKLVREAERGTAAELTRRGKAVAVLVGRRQYERLVGHHRSFFDAHEEFKRDVDLAGLAIDPDQLFAGARDDVRGRDVRL